MKNNFFCNFCHNHNHGYDNIYGYDNIVLTNVIAAILGQRNTNKVQPQFQKSLDVKKNNLKQNAII